VGSWNRKLIRLPERFSLIGWSLHDQDRAMGRFENASGYAPHDQMLDPRPSVGPDHYEVNGSFVRQGHNLLGWRTNSAKGPHSPRKGPTFFCQRFEASFDRLLRPVENLVEFRPHPIHIAGETARINHMHDEKVSSKSLGIIHGQFPSGFTILREVSAKQDPLWKHDMNLLLS
jgi:hypothetical protein